MYLHKLTKNAKHNFWITCFFKPILSYLFIFFNSKTFSELVVEMGTAVIIQNIGEISPTPSSSDQLAWVARLEHARGMSAIDNGSRRALRCMLMNFPCFNIALVIELLLGWVESAITEPVCWLASVGAMR